MSRARSVADLGNQNVLDLNANDGTLKVGAGVTIENTGEVQFAGIVTAATVQIGAATTLHSTGLDLGAGTLTCHNITSTGVLTYEDVTSVDSVGIITARSGIDIGTGTSISSPASNVLALGTNNVERLRISSTGQVGIGTDFVAGNPYNAKLSVEGVTAITNSDQTILVRDSNNDGAVGRGGNIGFEAYVDGTMRTLAAIGGVKEDTGTSFDGNLVLYTRRSAQANLDERLRITSNGLVGIGTDNPSAKFQVNNGSVVVRNTDDYAGTAGVFSRTISNSYEWTGSADNSAITQASFGLTIANSDQTTNSTLALAKFSTFRNSSSSNPGVVYIGAVDSGDGDNHSSDFIVALKGGDSTVTERLRVTHDGNLIINQDSKLHLEGTDDNDYNAIWKADTENAVFITSRAHIANIIDSNNDDTTGFWSVRHNATTLAGSGELMRVQSNGLVGIGTDTPNTLLHIKGTNTTQKLLTLSTTPFRRNYIGVNASDNLEIAADEDNEGDDSSIRFRVDGTEIVRIESGDFSGSVGPKMMLGTATDRGAMLHIAKNRGASVIQNYLCIGDGFILKYIVDSRLDATQRQRFTFVGGSRDGAIITISVVGRRGGSNTTGHSDAAEWKARVFSTSAQVTTLAGQGVQWTSGFADSHFIFTDNGGYGYTIDIDNPTNANDCDLSYDITIQNALGNQHRLVSTETITE